MNELQYVERSISVLEERTGILITIIDNDGGFRYRMKTCLFTPERASHRKNPVCRSGFCAECIQNCRYEMNKKCLAVAEPFLSVCWKGVTQLVIPLEENGVHYGMLYAGTWRTRKAKKPTGMPKDFYRIFAKLPILRKREAESLTALLGIYAAGILSYLKKNHVLNSSADFRNLRIMDYINEHVGDAFGLPDLASELGLSVPHTSCVVKRLFGKSFSALLQERRVEKAKYFLNGTELSLHEIAELCGFSSEFHFSRVFKQLNGIPPGQYRGKREI